MFSFYIPRKYQKTRGKRQLVWEIGLRTPNGLIYHNQKLIYWDNNCFYKTNTNSYKSVKTILFKKIP